MRLLLIGFILSLTQIVAHATEPENNEVKEPSFNAEKMVSFQSNRAKVDRLINKLLEDDTRTPAQESLRKYSEPAQ